jgi:hypothetical protein
VRQEQLTERKNDMNPNDFVFPSQVAIGSKAAESCQIGMTKREYFAAMAMQSALNTATASSEADLPKLFATVAGLSVQAADALLAELAK